MDMDRQSSSNVIAVYNAWFVFMYSLYIFVATVVGGFVIFTGESIESYILRKPAMLPFVLVIVVGCAYEITRCVIIFYNLVINRGKALFVQNNKIVFISKYFTSISIEKVARVTPRKKKAVYVILSNGKLKKIYTSFLTPSDPETIAKRIEALVDYQNGAK